MVSDNEKWDEALDRLNHLMDWRSSALNAETDIMRGYAIGMIQANAEALEDILASILDGDDSNGGE